MMHLRCKLYLPGNLYPIVTETYEIDEVYPTDNEVISFMTTQGKSVVIHPGLVPVFVESWEAPSNQNDGHT